MSNSATPYVILVSVIVGLGLYLAHPAPVRAGDYPNLEAPNDAGGTITLTFIPCQLQNADEIRARYSIPANQLLHAYATNFEGTLAGCWWSPAFNAGELPDGAEPVINIFTDQGNVFPHLASEFHVVPQPKANHDTF